MSKQFDKVLTLMTQKLILDRVDISEQAKPYAEAIKVAQKLALQIKEEKKAQKVKQKELNSSSDNNIDANHRSNKNILNTVNTKIDTTVGKTIDKTIETVQKVQGKIVKKVKTPKFMKLTHYATCSLGVAFDMYNASRGVNVYALYDAAKSIHPEIGSAFQSAYHPLQNLVKGYMYEFALSVVDKKVTRELERLKAHGHIEDYAHIIEAYQKVHQDSSPSLNHLTKDAMLETTNHVHFDMSAANINSEHGSNHSSPKINALEKTALSDSEANREVIQNKISHVADKIYFVRAKRLEAQQKRDKAILEGNNNHAVPTETSKSGSLLRKLIK